MFNYFRASGVRRRMGVYDGPKNNRWLKTLYGFWWQQAFFLGITRRRMAQRRHRERPEGNAPVNEKAAEDTNSSADVDLEDRQVGACDSSNESQ